MKPTSNLPDLSSDQVDKTKRLLDEVSGFEGLGMALDARQSHQKLSDAHTGPWKMIIDFDWAVSGGRLMDALHISAKLCDDHPSECWGAICFSQLALLARRPKVGFEFLQSHTKSHENDSMYCMQCALLTDLAGLEEEATDFVIRLVKMQAWETLDLLRRKLDHYRPPG